MNKEIKQKWVNALRENHTGTLISMNDGTGEFQDNPKSFTEIADWIEVNIEEE